MEKSPCPEPNGDRFDQAVRAQTERLVKQANNVAGWQIAGGAAGIDLERSTKAEDKLDVAIRKNLDRIVGD